MADFTDNGQGRPAKLQRALWPPQSGEATWLRLQPLIKAEELRAFHLFGLPLVSGEVDPATGQKQVMTDPLLQLYIERAVEIAEGETGLTLMPTLISENVEFDRNAFEAHGYITLKRKPVWGVERLTIRTADQQDVYTTPNDWISSSQMYRGQLYLIPLTLAFAGSGILPGPATGVAGAAFLASLGYYTWIPAYWGCDYMAGFPDGMIPALVNELVGTIASMEILSALAATNARVNSTSLAVDGLSQSQSLAGAQIYAVRLKDLEEKRRKIVNKLKTVFGSRWAFGTI